jgi:hypothetical protein
MSTAADLARQLKAKRTSTGWIARCPAHEDRTPSLSISEGEGGRMLLRCHAGCTFDQIIKAAGVEPTKPNGQDRSTKGRIVATYDYVDARGEVVFQVVRMAPKSFRQRRPNGNGVGSGIAAIFRSCPIACPSFATRDRMISSSSARAKRIATISRS